MKLYKYRSLSQIEFILDILLFERLYCARYNELNDPMEGMFYSEIKPPFMNMVVKQHCDINDLPFNDNDRICSLTENFEDIRLWSYYANGHQGVAIELSFPDDMVNLYKIDYQNKLPKLPRTILCGVTSIDALTFKAHHWAYEAEYRIIQQHEYCSTRNMISALYFGINTSNYMRELLIKVVPAHIPIFNTKLDRDNFKIIPDMPVRRLG